MKLTGRVTLVTERVGASAAACEAFASEAADVAVTERIASWRIE